MPNDRTIYVYADWEPLPERPVLMGMLSSQVKKAVGAWQKIAGSKGLPKREQDLMEGAFTR